MQIMLLNILKIKLKLLKSTLKEQNTSVLLAKWWDDMI